jgi:hypothetical protein
MFLPASVAQESSTVASAPHFSIAWFHEIMRCIMTRKISALIATPPDWLQKSWHGAKRRGLDKLTMKEIDAEIAAGRREKRVRAAKASAVDAPGCH